MKAFNSRKNSTKDKPLKCLKINHTTETKNKKLKPKRKLINWQNKKQMKVKEWVKNHIKLSPILWKTIWKTSKHFRSMSKNSTWGFCKRINRSIEIKIFIIHKINRIIKIKNPQKTLLKFDICKKRFLKTRS